MTLPATVTEPLLMVRCPGPSEGQNDNHGDRYKSGPCQKGRALIYARYESCGKPFCREYHPPSFWWTECPTCLGETYIPVDQPKKPSKER